VQQLGFFSNRAARQGLAQIPAQANKQTRWISEIRLIIERRALAVVVTADWAGLVIAVARHPSPHARPAAE